MSASCVIAEALAGIYSVLLNPAAKPSFPVEYEIGAAVTGTNGAGSSLGGGAATNSTVNESPVTKPGGTVIAFNRPSGALT